jgi:hypothetical protein
MKLKDYKSELSFAKELDQSDPLKIYREKFLIPKDKSR